MAALLVLIRPCPGTPLCLYISVSDIAINSALIQEKGEQRSVYFTSRVLQGAEKRYQKIEKAALALVMASRRLCPYFQNFSIIVRTDLPVRQVLRKPDLAGRMLSEFDISFKRRGHVKAQALADFITELTPDGPSTVDQGDWYLWSMGLQTKRDLEQDQTTSSSNNSCISTLEPIITRQSMRLAQELDAKRLIAKSDSRLVTGQVNNEYQTRDPQLTKYREQAVKLVATFEKFVLVHVPRDQNERADLLAKVRHPRESRSTNH
ncbi:rnhA, partial [Mucuna pruriens]